jgi:uncharacterized protein (TIGR00369 family)
MEFVALPPQEDHACIACGHANPHGLRMEFECDGEVLRSRTSIPLHLCGWRGVAHGGVLATVLDEVMANAVIVLLDRLAVTVEVRVSYVRPVPTGAPVTAQARISGRSRPDRAEATAELRDARGKLCAQAHGTFALLQEADFVRAGFAPEAVRESEQHRRRCRDILLALPGAKDGGCGQGPPTGCSPTR